MDPVVLPFLPDTRVALLEVEATEQSKTMLGVEGLVLQMRSAGVRRGDHVVAVGGGVVQDVATFAAQIYMRGLSWTYVPTTLMAMADSCIGGKSSINAGGIKNLVGGFHPPRRVVVDPAFLQGLSTSAMAAGFAEAAKITFCRGAKAFETYLECHSRFGQEPTPLLELALRTKQWFIEVDEHDLKERRLLNFGHTFGHALESAVDNRVSHGAAVAIGMLCALAHPAAAHTHATELLERHCRRLLSETEGLRSALGSFDATQFERAFRSDKKHSATSFRLIVPGADGVIEIETHNDEAGWSAVRGATAEVMTSLGVNEW